MSVIHRTSRRRELESQFPGAFATENRPNRFLRKGEQRVGPFTRVEGWGGGRRREAFVRLDDRWPWVTPPKPSPPEASPSPEPSQ